MKLNIIIILALVMVLINDVLVQPVVGRDNKAALLKKRSVLHQNEYFNAEGLWEHYQKPIDFIEDPTTTTTSTTKPRKY